MDHPSSRVDVLVVGGGPAGLSAALMLGRSRRSVLVVDAGQPRNAPAAEMHGFLGRDGTPPGDLLADGRKEVERYGVRVVDGRAVGAERVGEAFRVTLDDGSAVLARRLLLTTGLVDELPAVEGLAERWGRDVIHCPYCHGWEVRDRAIGVLATSATALHQAGLLRQLSDRVVVLRHVAAALDPEASAGLAARGVRFVDGEVVRLEVEDDAVRGVRFADGSHLPLEVLVVAPRLVGRSDLLDDLGLALVDHPSGAGLHVPTDPMGRSDVPGVSVAGNLGDPFAWVVAAAAQGGHAGAALNADLVHEDLALAREGT
jgi:thioredoxin reductase